MTSNRVVAGILSLFLSIVLTQSAMADANTGVDKAVLKRIQPIGAVYVTESTTVPNEATPTANQPTDKSTPPKNATKASENLGAQIYDKTCKTCHATGIGGAPKLGDATAWQPRVEQGMSVLQQHVLHGYNAMPPKGACPKCSDEEIKAAIEYMVSQSGVKLPQ